MEPLLMSTSPDSPTPVPSAAPGRDRGPVSRAIANHPVAAFIVLALGLTWIADLAAILLLGNLLPALLAELVIFIGVSTLVTAVAEGRDGVRRLFAGVVRWRVGVGWYFVAIFGLPVLTVLLALATGT